MTLVTEKRAGPNGLRFKYHSSFELPEAEVLYAAPAIDFGERGYMPDELTRAWAKRMHYAAWRAASPTREATRWRESYFEARNNIVVGNRKLTYRAVHKWTRPGLAEGDLVGECHLVLIRAVAAFDPWVGIRFSTYAFTCLMRALSRLSHRQAADRLSHSRPLETLPHGEPRAPLAIEPGDQRLSRLSEFFADHAPLLNEREKLVLRRRFHLGGSAPQRETLEQVGRELGLSKERVRQVQKTALLKLRQAFALAMPA